MLGSGVSECQRRKRRWEDWGCGRVGLRVALASQPSSVSLSVCMRERRRLASCVCEGEGGGRGRERKRKRDARPAPAGGGGCPPRAKRRAGLPLSPNPPPPLLLLPLLRLRFKDRRGEETPYVLLVILLPRGDWRPWQKTHRGLPTSSFSPLSRMDTRAHKHIRATLGYMPTAGLLASRGGGAPETPTTPPPPLSTQACPAGFRPCW